MNLSIRRPGWRWCRALAPALLSSFLAGPVLAQYVQSNLVSDLPGLAARTDPNLQNPWGIATLPNGPFWISDNGTGVSTVYNSSGTPFPLNQPLVVTIPAPASAGSGATSAPTGIVANSDGGFNVAGNPARFIFATEDGTIAAWNPRTGRNAPIQADRSGTSAIYKGLALGSNGTGNFLYATNFHAGTVDVFNSSFALTSLSGNFRDPSLPAGYAPFGIHNIGGTLFVTYALQDQNKEDDVAGPGHGFVDAFDTNGHLLQRIASDGPLDSPWGVVKATANFGAFSNDLLIGNFGDGRINAFDPTTHSFLGQLTGTNGQPITIQGLWGLIFGNGGNGGLLNHLYFTAGIAGVPGAAIEDHGLFGSLAPGASTPPPPIPEPGILPMLLIGGGLLFLWPGMPRVRRSEAA